MKIEQHIEIGKPTGEPIVLKVLGDDELSTTNSPIGLEQSTYASPIAAQHKPSSRRERDDHYADVVIHLSSRWRIIVCKDGIQWILQQRSVALPNTGTWSGKSYSTTRSGLMAACSDRELLLDPSEGQALDALPSTFREFITERPRS
ncbi:hypothetical protein [Planktomarina temperata]|jgi:hypothetical protein|uniref:Uncharacterized protein n=1 Tax=Planktomarina temperata RCA23 TaxID=666509 RepID=A0AAN0RKE2_9RHOB|nr:hypothetical protein RCA23_c22870 [Planktomarina temperata RCA23]